MSDYPISPVTGERPELTLTSAAINSEPAELDSTPASPEKLRGLLRGSKPAQLEEQHQLLSPEEQEQRAKWIAERKGDPAVLVDIPQTPQAEELEKSGANAGLTEGGGGGSESKTA